MESISRKGGVEGVNIKISKNYQPPSDFVRSWKDSEVTPEESARRHNEAQAVLGRLEEIAVEYVTEVSNEGVDYEEIADLFQNMIEGSTEEAKKERQERFLGWTDQQLDDLLDMVRFESSERNPRNY